MSNEIWTLSSGEKVRVNDMDEQHVRNALKMTIRRSVREADITDLIQKVIEAPEDNVLAETILDKTSEAILDLFDRGRMSKEAYVKIAQKFNQLRREIRGE